MQIKYPHKSTRSLFQLPLSRKKCESEAHPYKTSVQTWWKLKAQGVSDKICQEITGISRATFFRRQKALESLNLWLTLPSKRPKNLRKPLWGEAHVQQVLAVRRANPTYGKAKIAQILRRDDGSTLSESTVGRILKSLMKRGLIMGSASAPRKKKKRRFTGHAKPYQYGMKPAQWSASSDRSHVCDQKSDACQALPGLVPHQSLYLRQHLFQGHKPIGQAIPPGAEPGGSFQDLVSAGGWRL